MAATNDRVPCVYLKNRRVVGLDTADPIEVTYAWEEADPSVPTGRHNPDQLKMMYSHGHDGTIINGVSRIGHMRGGKAALWTDETMADVFAEQAVCFVEENRDTPFFLYYAFHQPHVPRLPHPRFKGATPHGPRGDAIVELDACVGRLLDALEQTGLRDQTLILFSSDNGPVLDDGYVDQAVPLNGGHTMAGPLRGGKYSLFDGGTRVPFIVSWPNTVPCGESAALISHVDLYASFAALLKRPLTEDEAPDSFNVLDALLGRQPAGRCDLVAEGMQGETIYRAGDWVLIPPYDGPAINPFTNTELGHAPAAQLYDLSADLGQRRNRAAEQAVRATAMQADLSRLLASEQTRL